MASGERRDEAHQEHLLTEGENVPGETREELLAIADELASAQSRGELMGVVEAAYSIVGRWEDFLGGGDGR